MNLSGKILLAAGVMFLVGCEWPEPPISTPNAEIDTRLIGDWKSTDDGWRLKIAHAGERRYEITVGGAEPGETVMRFRGHHTDIEGFRIISMEILEMIYPTETIRPPEGRQHRWKCVSYTFTEDGLLEPKYLAIEIPDRSSAAILETSGDKLYDTIRAHMKSPYHRERLFVSGSAARTFRREPNK